MKKLVALFCLLMGTYCFNMQRIKMPEEDKIYTCFEKVHLDHLAKQMHLGHKLAHRVLTDSTMREKISSKISYYLNQIEHCQNDSVLSDMLRTRFEEKKEHLFVSLIRESKICSAIENK